MRTRCLAIIVAVVLLMQFSLGQMLNTAAALAVGSSSLCHDPTPAKYLPRADSITTPLAPTVGAARVTNRIGSPSDTEIASRDLSTGSADAIAKELARKDVMNAAISNHGSMTILPDLATLERECGGAGSASLMDAARRLAIAATPSAEASYGPGYRWLDWMNQQGQTYYNYCGPATVSEIANTMANNGRLSGPVSQSTAATSMHTDSSGTSVSDEVAGLNQYVGQPIGQPTYYRFVWLTGSADPTTHNNEVNTFLTSLMYDLSYGWAVGGDAWEAPYDYHLVGHPASMEIKHWFQIGGYQSSGASTYYSDSATTMGWSGVQPFSWYDTGNLVYILGGFGYAW